MSVICRSKCDLTETVQDYLLEIEGHFKMADARWQSSMTSCDKLSIRTFSGRTSRCYGNLHTKRHSSYIEGLKSNFSIHFQLKSYSKSKENQPENLGNKRPLSH
ncbi:hypothetical protein ACROYT_G033616 [Oculina patagonica]